MRYFVSSRQSPLYVVVAACVILRMFGNATANDQIVMPPGFENVEGDEVGAAGAPPSAGSRLQILYPFSDVELPADHNTIVNMKWRPDHTQNTPNTMSFGNFEVRLSNTSATSLDRKFANNIVDDETLVYSGPIVFSTQGDGDPEGPRPFDYPIEFQRPFVYDPAMGNMLMDILLGPPIEGIGPNLDNQSTTNIATIFARGLSPETASNVFREYAVADFSFVPDARGCDLNGDGVCDYEDLESLEAPKEKLAYLTMPSPEGLGTVLGDVNLDFRFDSDDLIEVFSAGEYSDDIEGNSTYIEGDWNFDHDFNSDDLIEAFAGGNYNVSGGAAAVPEPKAILLLIVGSVSLRRRHRNRPCCYSPDSGY